MNTNSTPLKKTFRNFAEMIEGVRRVSYSLRDSIPAEVTTEADLRAVLVANQRFYGHDESLVASHPSRYWTGGGTTVAWEYNDDDSVTAALYHPRGWHVYSTLLASAWRAGWRGPLAFNYGLDLAQQVQSAKAKLDALNTLTNGEGRLTIAQLLGCEDDGEYYRLMAQAIADAALRDAEARAVLRTVSRAVSLAVALSVSQENAAADYDDDDDDVTGVELRARILQGLREQYGSNK